jgi:ribosomal protein S18 acetylase RimI-like enzyme
VTVTTRWATAEDEPALAALEAVSWNDRSGFPSAQEREGSFFSEGNPPEVHLVAELEGEVVGYLKLKHWTPLPENAHVLGCLGLAVAPSARRKGVAATLLQAAEREARTRGARKIRLGVFSTNDAARALYERHGYVQEARLVDEWLIGGRWVDDLQLARYLDPPEDAD